MPDSQQHLDSRLSKPLISRKTKRSVAWIWLVPLVAVIIGISIVWSSYNKRGPTITISFSAATGLEIGKTQVRFRDVIIGLVKDIKLAEKRDGVLVFVELNKEAQGFAQEGAKFWVVKPRIGLGGVSGLNTLLSGSYIAVDSVDPTNESPNQRAFVGLEVPPPIFNDQPGSSFVLHTTNLGSLEPGAPVYYKQIQVGLVTDYSLDSDGDKVSVKVFINAPYDKFVTKRTRFFNASGIDLNVGAQGIEVNTQSLISILAGGIAFENLGSNRNEPADRSVPFKLYDSVKEARAEPEGLIMPITMTFSQSTKGLVKGAPIDFRGVDLGRVEDIQIQFDSATKTFSTVVTANLYFHRLGKEYERIVEQKRTLADVTKTMSELIDGGLRAQLRVGNILSGQLYITLADFHNVKPVVTEASLPINVPTVPTESIEELQSKLSSIIAKLDKIPYQDIGQNLNQALKQFNVLTADIDKGVLPSLVQSFKQLDKTLQSVDALIAPGSQLPQNIGIMLQELNRGLRSVRGLTDTLQTQPDSVILGRTTKNYNRETLGAPNP